MRMLALVLVAGSLWAQDAAKPAEAASPVPAAEPSLTGSIDLGYQFRTHVAGSFDTYRTFVNLGEGPKLIGTDFTLVDPKHRLFDQLHVDANDFGDGPYQSLRVDARKAKWYDFRASYRDIAYFNFLPSYADPQLASRGIILDQQSFDTRRKLGSFQIDFLPANWIVPYAAFEFDSGSGTGATTFIGDRNEYPVPNRLRDLTNLYRAGVRFELRRFHATIEQGGTTFKDDQSLFQPAGTKNAGDNPTTVSGQALNLSSLLAAYGIRGHSVFSKALFTARPVDWLDLYGQFLFSQPQSDIRYNESAAGTLFSQSQFLLYSSEQFLLNAAAKLPHTTGSAGAEIRPFKRVRIVESWMTDRLHNSSASVSAQTLLGQGVNVQTAAAIAGALATNYSQQEIDIFFDASKKLTLRGGHKYVWGDASDLRTPPAGLASSDAVKFRRQVGLGGFTFKPNAKLTLRAEAEAGSSGSTYFRTSLYDYQRIRAQARFALHKSLTLAGDFSALSNQNPLAGIKYDFLSQQESLSLLFTPKDAKLLTVEGSYTRSSLRSDINYLVPQDLTVARSFYRENAHTATGLFTLNLPRYRGIAAKLTGGGSLFISSGSRPTNFYQPVAKLFVPVTRHVGLFSEWRYYGYGEDFYMYESFRTHLVIAGLRLTR